MGCKVFFCKAKDIRFKNESIMTFTLVLPKGFWVYEGQVLNKVSDSSKICKVSLMLAINLCKSQESQSLNQNGFERKTYPEWKSPTLAEVNNDTAVILLE